MGAKTIDDVIEACRQDLGVPIPNGATRKQYRDFLARQLEAHTEYDIDHKPKNARIHPYFSLLKNKLYVFSVLVRKKGVRPGFCEEPVLVDSEDKLILLKTPGDKPSSCTDPFLCEVFIQTQSQRKRYPKLSLPLYIALVNELGKDPAVRRVWGRELSYNPDICKHQRLRPPSGRQPHVRQRYRMPGLRGRRI